MKGQPKRRALGKGLGSLIPEIPAGPDPLGGAAPAGESSASGAGGPLEVPVDEIRPNPHQPRTHFSEEEIESLAESIRSAGIIQPLLVRREPGGGYTLVAGERRLRAAKRAGLEKVPVVVRDLPDERLLEIALIENLQRDELGPLETARAFRVLVRRFGLTQAEVASRVGKPRSTVANYLRLLDLPEPVQRLLEEGVLEMGHGRALAGLASRRDQVRLAAKAARLGWSVRALEDAIRRLAERGGGSRKDSRRDPNVVAAEEDLSRALGAPVRIHVGRSGSGKLEVRFADADDLDRLYRLLGSLGEGALS